MEICDKEKTRKMQKVFNQEKCIFSIGTMFLSIDGDIWHDRQQCRSVFNFWGLIPHFYRYFGVFSGFNENLLERVGNSITWDELVTFLGHNGHR